MKFLKSVCIAALGTFALSSCVDKEADYKVFPDADVDFTYNVDGDQFALDYYVVSTIQFNNKSAKSGSYIWDFGDGTTSNEVSPKHKYAVAGQYKVKLTLDGVGYCEYPISIADIVPALTVNEQSDEILVINDTKVNFNIFLPNPENLRVRYEWAFPEGTKDENGNALESFTGYGNADGSIDYPGNVTFSNIGSQKIEIKTYFDVDGENRRLDDAYLNVQVGSPVEAPTLYYAQRDGNIKAIKLVDLNLLPKGTKVMPYDMGVKSGNNPFQICYGDVTSTDEDGAVNKEGWVYILDAGKQYYYINDENGNLGDGQITAMRTDGTNVNVVITNVGGYAFNDPFQGFIKDGILYYSDRGTGVSQIDMTSRGNVQGANSAGNRDSYVFKNELIPYYGRGIAYGAISTGMWQDSKGMWYWSKNYSGTGLYRFKQSDIYTTNADAAAAKAPYPILLSGAKIRSFAVDEKRNALYIWRLETNEGLNVYTLPAYDDALSITQAAATYVKLEADKINTTADEGVYTTQMVIDDETGRVYFGFRPASGDTSGLGQGIVYYDPATKKCARYGETNDAILGITINPNKTKLF